MRAMRNIHRNIHRKCMLCQQETHKDDMCGFCKMAHGDIEKSLKYRERDYQKSVRRAPLLQEAIETKREYLKSLPPEKLLEVVGEVLPAEIPIFTRRGAVRGGRMRTTPKRRGAPHSPKAAFEPIPEEFLNSFRALGALLGREEELMKEIEDVRSQIDYMKECISFLEKAHHVDVKVLLKSMSHMKVDKQLLEERMKDGRFQSAKDGASPALQEGEDRHGEARAADGGAEASAQEVLRTVMPCPNCGGVGTIFANESECECARCEGSGEVEVRNV